MIGKNNPLNLRYSILNPWQGQCGETRGFCNFRSSAYGVRASCILLMQSYRKKGCKTIRSVITRFAPPQENETSRYIAFVCRMCSMSPDEEIRPKDYPHVIHAMSWMEVGFCDCVTVAFVEMVISQFQIKCYGEK